MYVPNSMDLGDRLIWILPYECIHNGLPAMERVPKLNAVVDDHHVAMNDSLSVLLKLMVFWGIFIQIGHCIVGFAMS